MASGKGMTLQKPPPLVQPELETDGDPHFSLEQLEENDERFQQIVTDFKGADLKVLKVEFLKNPHLWKRYQTERDLIVEHRENIGDSGFQLNEKYLYHGTSENKSQICDQGLDARMSKEGCFGKGIYFSDYPRKCVKYAKPKSGSESYILLVRVIRGVAKVFPKGQKARHLVREPQKEAPYEGHNTYDSVEGQPINHKEFVVYESRRALVEGLIMFEDVKPRKKVKEPCVEEHVDSDDEDFQECVGDADETTDDEEIFGDACDELSSEESDSDEENEDDKDEDSNRDTDSDSDDDEDSEIGLTTNEEVEQLLIQTSRMFSEATGVEDEFEIACYLLRGVMNVNAAVKIYEEMKAKGFPDREDSDDDPTVDTCPLPKTDAWTELSKEEQDKIIEDQINDFMDITDLEPEQREFAKEKLEEFDMSVRKAVRSYYGFNPYE